MGSAILREHGNAFSGFETNLTSGWSCSAAVREDAWSLHNYGRTELGLSRSVVCLNSPTTLMSWREWQKNTTRPEEIGATERITGDRKRNGVMPHFVQEMHTFSIPFILIKKTKS